MKAMWERAAFEAELVPKLLLSRRHAWLPRLVCLFFASYLIQPYFDIIPSRYHPLAGHIDEMAAIILAWAGLRLLSPAVMRPQNLAPGTIEALQFKLRMLQGDLGNFFLYQHRRQDGFVVSGKNSGTHWLKFMLNVAFSSHFGVEPPPFSSGEQANHIVGGAKSQRPFAHLPHFASSHSIPSGLFAWPGIWRIVPRRPIVVLVRNIPDALESNYAKWQNHYCGDMEDFARGDPLRKRFSTDVWWYIHFFNRWGDVARANPGLVLFVRYEDLQRDPGPVLRKVAAHFGIALTSADIAAAMAYTAREKIRALEDARYGEEIVPADHNRANVRFGPQARRILTAILDRHLRFAPSFGLGETAFARARDMRESAD